MARFIAEIQGQAGEVSRIGSPNSGIACHIRGWDLGIEVRGSVDAQGRDVFTVFQTGGSNGGRRTLLANIVHVKDRPITQPAGTR